MTSTLPIKVTWRGRSAIVRQNETHPEQYLFLDIDGEGRYFLGVLVAGMTRGDVKAMARKALQSVDARDVDASAHQR